MIAAEKTVRIVNKRGLHARAAAKFVKMVESLGPSLDVQVCREDMQVCGSSIMGLLMLAASKDTDIHIVVRGEGARAALEKLTDLVSRRFGEEA